jgi:hypothetical protein
LLVTATIEFFRQGPSLIRVLTFCVVACVLLAAVCTSAVPAIRNNCQPPQHFQERAPISRVDWAHNPMDPRVSCRQLVPLGTTFCQLEIVEEAQYLFGLVGDDMYLHSMDDAAKGPSEIGGTFVFCYSATLLRRASKRSIRPRLLTSSQRESRIRDSEQVSIVRRALHMCRWTGRFHSCSDCGSADASLDAAV